MKMAIGMTAPVAMIWVIMKRMILKTIVMLIVPFVDIVVKSSTPSRRNGCTTPTTTGIYALAVV